MLKMDESQMQDICRVCRSEATPEKPLYHPCICTGSIKFIHQECLLQWLKYSRKEYCELCNHRFSFMPIYSPDMPKRLPIKDIFSGLLCSLGTAVRFWLHYTLVAVAWLGIVPLTACRIYRCLFTGSLTSILSLPLDMLSTENILSDSLYGCCVVTCTLCAFISLVWLREQILHGGGPEWLDHEHDHEHDHDAIHQHVIDHHHHHHIEFANNNVQANAPPPVPENVDDDGNEGNNAQDVNNWNPIEWDHAAEELTWERLLGLDGSLVFLEHVFWVVSLNTLFIVVFAFCPYHIGQFALSCFGFKDYLRAPEFEGLLTTLFGYINIGIALALLHGIAALVRLHRTRRLLGICYVVIKVSLLSVIEIGIFPLVCGWWLDICSLTMLDATIHDREAGFRLAPGTSMFIHWLAGMVYVFYFASFILLLREVLRPGILWFLKNLNDPDFNPIQEMIHSPILRHIRRVLMSLVTFGTTILLVVWLPVRIVEKLIPGFLPYYVILSSEMPYSELSLELVLLQVILPALLEQGHMRHWLKLFIRTWCIGVSYILDMRSYLLGDTDIDEQPPDAAVPAPPADGEPQEGFPAAALAAAHQALFQAVSPSSFQPYKRPKYLPFKIVCLIIFMCISLTMASLVMITVPVFVGRKLMSLWLGSIKVHELYTIGCGLYVCWIMLRVLTLLWSWIPRGWNTISSKLKEWLTITVKMVCAMTVLLGLIPVMMGLLLDLILTVPARVSLNQTPIISVWQDWAIGVLLTKTFCAVVLVGPNWWMKRVIEQVYLGGIRNVNLRIIFIDLALPVIVVLGLSLAVPYIIACSIIPMFSSSFELQNAVLRRIYPALLALCLTLGATVFQVRQFFRLYEHIKNDKYLVGKRLVNYEHRRLANVTTPVTDEDTVAS
ncbi:E3 ubiquitin-protein ligase MARCHF6-like isoform X2 [Stegodyphus dumicola]|uniref:E3 ubiquitin-protein ligase MARCHF6-like isoform X2 n=1 Tax=Stegodyphus dumicola TaxID=202533 RepID=UPI0015AC9CB6|nr:E3 ubiquitin-protein ligase MARCHF6-like isoform X2 [Stegodyphus dumicola]